MLVRRLLSSFRTRSPAAAAWGEHADDVARPQVDGSLVGKAFRRLLVAAGEEPVLPYRSGFAAPEAHGWETRRSVINEAVQSSITWRSRSMPSPPGE